MLPIDFFWRAVQRHGARTALIGPRRSLTFAELGREVQALAAALQAIDPPVADAPASRVGLGAVNSEDHVLALLAILAAGKVWVPLNPRSGTPELRRIVEFTEPSILMLDAAMCGRLGDMGPRVAGMGDARELADCGLTRLLQQHAAAAFRPVERDLAEVQAIKFTGGTTGVPKGVMQGCRAWNAMIASQWHAFGFGPDDRFLVSAPLTHGSSTYVLPILGAGGALVLPEETKPAALLDAMARHAVTTLFVPPIMVHLLVEELARSPVDVASLRNVIYGAAPMSEQRIREAQAAFGPVLATTYGQTEAPQIITCLDAQSLREPRNMASVGRPGLMTRVGIAGPDGRPQPADALPGSEGEVLVRGDLVMNGYWRNPEKTAQTLAGGWLHTGDVGVLDERGFLYLKGRSDDVIISGGFNVHPADVEAVLVRHPAVSECCIVGIADEKWGEAVTAAITLKPGMSLDAAELIAFAKAEVGSVQAPKTVHVLDSLPRTAVDKVPRKAVKAEIERRLAGPERA